MYEIKGHHHISMVTKNGSENNHFYKNVLGLRRVKMTVNQDDPSMYHLFYGDKTGSPGTELSFFEMPLVGKTYRGTNAITRIGLLVPSEESLHYWKERFEKFGVKHSELTTYANRPALQFEDAEGLRLVLLVSNGEKVEHWETWEKSEVPAKHQIQGMGSVEMTVRRLDKLASTLTDIFGYTEVSRSDEEAIFQSIKGEAFGEIVVKYLDGPTEKPGRGSIHHLAIRVKNDAELAYWEEQVIQRGFHSSGIIDRFYFKSLYFRESNGILFEIATDGPGFTVDGDVEHLGEKLDLPPFLEDQRAEIEAKLAPIEEK
ncbi:MULTISPECIES: ring-cleaving dioxygenase [Bacillus]|uniref:Ring-cleaving dioxygenase n=1 Tax=Bacillus thuringiensis serovar sooncheon TaxID=180891 RepID=A0A9Q5SJV8_BACTU|nr:MULTISPECIES: ring-cleaving dioxygenase [Bacillus]MDC7973640.1 ring-cleaving dioxygenase [Bacillus sp. BLCC-B18]OTW67649.1 ring-cleaving dioxygenase [Bacillus thuringiensis serovar coreanensis]OTX44266.1 ring-cleaving dioxygenase [Bacillus thuringiensis serovar sooncheon]OTX53429.1 ring-cleaving dioxygenase [Bacillus thuringiensis serovar guiyangiensis]OTX67750.1 ring-cleaving dioxygenase [Bacillus thuringiensis serovar roskildiensis]